jgi:hypothetical protein
MRTIDTDEAPDPEQGRVISQETMDRELAGSGHGLAAAIQGAFQLAIMAGTERLIASGEDPGHAVAATATCMVSVVMGVLHEQMENIDPGSGDELLPRMAERVVEMAATRGKAADEGVRPSRPRPRRATRGH